MPSKSQHPGTFFPGLNPTSDYFTLQDYRNPPYSSWFGSTNASLKPWARILNDLLCSPVSRLDCIFNFYVYLTCSHITSLTMKHFIRVSLILCFHQKPDVLLKRKVVEYLFGTSSPCPSLPACLPLLRDSECCCCVPSLLQKHILVFQSHHLTVLAGFILSP